MLIVLATLRDKLVRKAVKWTWIMFGDFSINDVFINGLKKYSNIMLTFNKPLCVTVLHYFLIYCFLSWFLSLLSVWLHWVVTVEQKNDCSAATGSDIIA